MPQISHAAILYIFSLCHVNTSERRGLLYLKQLWCGIMGSLLRSRFLDVTQRLPTEKHLGGALRDIPKKRLPR